MNTLTQIAVIGTSKAGALVPETGTPADVLAASLTGERERTLLLQAGAAAVYRLAGARPLVPPARPAPAPAETREPCPPGVAGLVARLVDGEESAVLVEALRAIERRGGRLPFELLPAALELGTASAPHRPRVTALLGERGRWLARQNPKWAWGLTGTETEPLPDDADLLFQEGAFAQRLALLRHARAVDPARARQLVEGTFANDKAEARAAFLGTFAVGLSLEDEPLLERALDDRSAGVRAAAARILPLLPSSRLGQRMADRAAALLSFGGAALVVEPPKEIDPSAERDGIPRTPPQGAGARAFWLTEILSRVPPTRFEVSSGLAPGDLLRLAGTSDWKDALLAGWTAAALRFAVPGWAAPLLDATPPDARADGLRQDLLARLPLAEAEERAGSLLRKGERSADAMALLARLPAPWSEALSRLAVDAMRRAAGSEETFLETLSLAAPALAPELLDVALAAWPPPAEDAPWASAHAAFLDTVRFRMKLREEIARWPI